MLSDLFCRSGFVAVGCLLFPAAVSADTLLAFTPDAFPGGLGLVQSNASPPPPMSIDASLYFGQEEGLGLASAVLFQEQAFTTADIGRRFKIGPGVPGFEAVASELGASGPGRFFFELKFSDRSLFSPLQPAPALRLPFESEVSLIEIALADLVFETVSDDPVPGITTHRVFPRLSTSVFGTVPEPAAAGLVLAGLGVPLLRRRRRRG